MDLLTNAKESIQVGVEDYHQGSRPRLLSAVRNIHAGILILFKSALQEYSPPDSKDALMMERIAPQKTGNVNKVIFVGVGKKTATVEQIRERFDALGIPVDWGRFKRINETRNEIEHSFPKVDQNSLRGLVADAFTVMRAFIRDVLNLDPSDILGMETWQSMLKVEEVYRTERNECDESIAKAKWKSAIFKSGVQRMVCPACASDLLEPNEDRDENLWLECRSCRSHYAPEVWEVRALLAELSAQELESKEGRPSTFGSCPSCGASAFLASENTCLICGYVRTSHCVECGKELTSTANPYSSLCEKCSEGL